MGKVKRVAPKGLVLRELNQLTGKLKTSPGGEVTGVAIEELNSLEWQEVQCRRL